MEYFDRKSSKWNILDFLNASTDIEPFDLKIDFYIKTLESIFDHEQGSRKQRARALLDDYRKESNFFIRDVNGKVARQAYWVFVIRVTNQCWGHRWLTGLPNVQGYWLDLALDGPTSDQELAKNWEKTHRNGSSINILNSTVLASGTIYGGTTNGGTSNIDISNI
ncbi:hypothetical protein F8M41_019107 [Gigaspora margarita]|uniref:Uncharacterized protein n=1 Tax=Gigaspora margarita TaxID=4874 RepID=A0A8H4AKQ9_GIGMA|nr:hypothetical protein F8M41_019107 [Gigaspora margarita]